LTGNPVRKNLLSSNQNKEEASKYFKLKSGRPVVLILGGSLGARTINESVMANLELISLTDVEVLWQTGNYYFTGILERLGNKKPENLHPSAFVTQMDMAYTLADVVISRAGAGTISELCALGKPAILVPSPNVAEDHQTKNAKALVENQAALLIKDSEAKDKLLKETFILLEDKQRLQNLSENILKLGRPNAAKDIVDVILEVIKK
jgi:UDP-N-acetylglucosamine--N-acetylmuramyl-(pentapeptide) pyrophosphoryl-undecaprenol N-acetylglucosamine transferase